MSNGYSSLVRIEWLGLLQDRFRYHRFEASTPHQINAPSEQSGPLALHSTQGEKADPGLRPEFHQQIHIALRPDLCAGRTRNRLTGRMARSGLTGSRRRRQA